MPKKLDAKKVVEDKTFGMKNKSKSKKIQNFIENMQKTASRTPAAMEAENRRRAKMEAEKAKELEKQTMAVLFKPVIDKPKLAAGIRAC